MSKLAMKVLVLSASISAAAAVGDEAKAEAEEVGAVASPAAGSQPEHERELYGPKLKCDCYAVCDGHGLFPYDNANCDYVDPHEAKKLFVNCHNYVCPVQQCAPGTVFDGYGCGHPKFEDIKWEPYCIDHVKKGSEEYIPSPCGTDGYELYFPEYWGDPTKFIQCEPTTGKCYRKMCMPNKDEYIPTFWYEGYHGEGACTYPYNIPKDSCTDRCGYYDPYLPCQCDEGCYYNDDCCYDYRGQCLPHTCSHLPKHDSCQDRKCIYDYECSCQCDYYCKALGDCCDDAPDYCYVGGLGDGLGIEEVGDRFSGPRPERGGGEGRNRRAEQTDRDIAERNGHPVHLKMDGVRRGKRNDPDSN